MLNIIFKNLAQRRICSYSTQNFAGLIKRTATTESESGINDALEIEAKLFENSSRKHSPVTSTKKLLQQTQTNTKSDIRKPYGKTSKFSLNSEGTKKAPKVIHDVETGVQFYRGGEEELVQLMTSVRSQKRRDVNRKIVIEGRRLILEALSNNLCMEALIFSQKDQLITLKENVLNAQKIFHTKIYKVSQHELKTWSTLTTPPGILAVFKKPTNKDLQHLSTRPQTLPITVVCDNIREPNNLGSIIRTCAAIPCSQLLITKGCCDPWESKALRGGCGGHFRLPILDDVQWEDLHNSIPEESWKDCHIFIAENNFKKALKEADGKAVNYNDLGRLGTHNIVVIGGESHGVSDDAYRFLESSKNGKCLYIPLAEGIDSLNVASALTLILYEFRSKLLQKQTSEYKSQDSVVNK